MKILGIADTHSHTPKLPKSDILIIAGDYSFISKYATENVMIPELKTFNNWLKTIHHKYGEILFVPGNHDFLFETNEKLARKLLTEAVVLIDEEIVIGGVKFYGSPVTPRFKDWAFNKDSDIKEYWDKIPNDTDVLITHGPPMGILDQIHSSATEYLGCSYLFARIQELNLKAHFFGHIHGGNGRINIGDISHCNCSISDESYRNTGRYMELELK